MATESFDEQQKRLKAEREYKQNEIEKAEQRLFERSGQALKDWATTHDYDLPSDPDKQQAVAREMAHLLAERGVRTGNLDLVDQKDHRDVPDEAIRRVEEREQNPEPPGQDKSPKSELSARQPEGTPERQPESDPERQQPQSYADLKLENARGLGQGQEQQEAEPSHPQLECTGAEEPTREKPELFDQREPVRTYADLKQEHADIIGRSEESLPMEEPGRKKLEFFEDRENQQEHGSTRENDGDAREQGKKLEFFQDRNPSNDHGIEH
ncbi:MAG: hypothetical protein WDN02_11050 [Methylovirgula sp.]|uniref:hypothetical protein n=1 Tax=Methylovirgula sp. TaxID=1978224 RepID=UPI0030767C47